MLEGFKNYLIEQGYKEITPSGHPSTVYDYGKRIERVCERERITIKELADNISRYVAKYDTFGSEAEYGQKSSSSVINALRRFEEFYKQIKMESDNNNKINYVVTPEVMAKYEAFVCSEHKVKPTAYLEGNTTKISFCCEKASEEFETLRKFINA